MALELAFDSKALRAVCEGELQAILELGTSVAETLKRRLADLQAATSVGDLLVGRPRIVDGTDGLRMVIDLSEDYRLVFTANHINNPLTAAGNLDWTRVGRIKILSIERGNG